MTTKIHKPDYVVNDDIRDYCLRLHDLIEASNHAVAFTGAGISAESGIPTYRGQGGIWNKYDPEKFASIEYFKRDPSYYWSFFKEMRYPVISEANPNASHYALAELEAQGKIKAVITQNIDGLHLRAGSKNVLELHGNTTRYYCVGCGKKYAMDTVWEMVQETIPVKCTECADDVRADVVMFGEMLPQDTLYEAERQTELCDLLIVIGSSLVVYPAAGLPYMAKQHGANLAILNLDPTPMDGMAELCAHIPSANVLAGAVWGVD